jgi:single-strand DNA-binding protein
LGADAELRSTASGEKVLSFRVPSTSGYGEKKKSEWVDCSYWGRAAEAVAPYMRKGGKVTVIGELSLESFTRRDGTPGTKLAVRVDKLDLPSKNDGASTGGYVPDHQAPLGGGGGQDYGTQTKGGAGGRGGGKPAFNQDLDDEIPF